MNPENEDENTKASDGLAGDESKNLTDSSPSRGSDEPLESREVSQYREGSKNPADSSPPRGSDEPLRHSMPGAEQGAGHEENRELEWARRHVRDDPAEKHLLEVFRKTELRVRPPAEEARRRYRCRKLQEMRRGRSP